MELTLIKMLCILIAAVWLIGAVIFWWATQYATTTVPEEKDI